MIKTLNTRGYPLFFQSDGKHIICHRVLFDGGDKKIVSYDVYAGEHLDFDVYQKDTGLLVCTLEKLDKNLVFRVSHDRARTWEDSDIVSIQDGSIG